MMRAYGAFILAAGMAVSLAGQRHVATPRIVATFSDSKLTSENMPHLVQLSDGRVMALFVTNRADGQDMTARYSDEHAESWSTSQTLFHFPREAGGFGYFDAFVDRDGEVHVFYLNDANTGSILPAIGKPVGRAGDRYDIWHAKSQEKGKSWKAPRRIWEGRAGDPLSVIQLSSGRILLPLSYRTNRTWRSRGEGFLQFTYVGSYSSSALYSDDGGETWKASPDELTVPAPSLGAIGGVEPVALELKDGRVWMLIRTEMGRFYETFSRNGGERWSAPQPTTLISSESPAGLVRLRDGRIVLFVNSCLRFPYAYGGRHVLHGAISTDEGRTWRGFREIVRAPYNAEPPPPNGDWGVSYAFPLLLRGADILFSTWVLTGTPRYLYRIDPEWLEETKQATDFPAGLEDWSVFGTKAAELVVHPEQPSRHVLAIHRTTLDWPAGAAVWNFPLGFKGRLRLRMMLKEKFGGVQVGLNDHFSVPFDLEDRFHNVFNLLVTATGEAPGGKIERGRWHRLEFDWDTGHRTCRVLLDGRETAVLNASRLSGGINYLRLRSTASNPDEGLLIESVDADVSESRGGAR